MLLEMESAKNLERKKLIKKQLEGHSYKNLDELVEKSSDFLNSGEVVKQIIHVLQEHELSVCESEKILKDVSTTIKTICQLSLL